MIFILDASAMIAYLRDERGSDFMDLLLKHPRQYYSCMRSIFAKYSTIYIGPLESKRLCEHFGI